MAGRKRKLPQTPNAENISFFFKKQSSDTESADVHAASTATTATTTATTTTATTATVAIPPTSAAATTGASNESEPSNSNNEDVTKRFKRLPKFAAFFMRKNETKRKQADNETGGNAAAAQPEGTDGNDNEPKEDNQLVYAELVLKPAAENNEPLTPKNSTEYAEIVYVQKNNPDVVKK